MNLVGKGSKLMQQHYKLYTTLHSLIVSSMLSKMYVFKYELSVREFNLKVINFAKLAINSVSINYYSLID